MSLKLQLRLKPKSKWPFPFRPSHKKRGALLLEVLLSIIILSVSVGVLIQSLTANLRALVSNSGYVQALFLMENKLFELVYMPKEQLSGSTDKKFDAPFDAYGYRLDAKDLKDSENIKELTLKVNWQSGWKKNSISADTYVWTK